MGGARTEIAYDLGFIGYYKLENPKSKKNQLFIYIINFSMSHSFTLICELFEHDDLQK